MSCHPESCVASPTLPSCTKQSDKPDDLILLKNPLVFCGVRGDRGVGPGHAETALRFLAGGQTTQVLR